MFSRLRRLLFPFLLALGLIVVQIFLAWFINRQAGPDRIWLGDYLWNSADQAVYFTYIEQAKQGALTFRNLYAPVEADRFVHLLFVPIGWLAALFHLTPLWAHELGRWLVTFISVYLLYRIAQTMTKDERDARIATATIVLGGGIGWMVVVYQALNGIFPADFSAPADVTSETFFFPTIIGGAHIMLSTALLAYGLHRLWIELEPDSRSHVRSLVSIAALFALHPYFVPLVGLYVLVLMLFKRLPWRYILKLACIYGVPLLLAIAPHAWSQWHDPYRRFFIQENHLPLGSLMANIFSFLPWIGFIAWRVRKHPLKKEERWIIAWVVVALILISIPSLHFKRKMLEGLAIGIILLAFPVWKDVLRWAKRTGKIAHMGMWAMILLSPLSLVQSQAAWVTRPMGRGDEFFMSQDLVLAWQWLRTSTPGDAVILPDDAWVGVWTPPNSERYVWIGHDHETPEWRKRRAFLEELFVSQSPERVQAMLKETGATVIMTTRAKNALFVQENAGPAWQEEKRFGAVVIWSKK